MRFIPKSRVALPKRRGFTLIELLAASSILVLLIIASLSLFRTGTSMYAGVARGAFSEADISRASRRIETELGQASYYEVSADGKTVKYQLLKHTNGVPDYPPAPDGGTGAFRQFTVSGTSAPFKLTWIQTNGTQTRILSGMPTAAIFAPANSRSINGAVDVLTATLTSEQEYSAGYGTKRVARQSALVRVLPRNTHAIANNKK